MADLMIRDLQAHVQAHLNCVELCKAFRKQAEDPDVRQALELVIDDLQEALAALARHLRQQGATAGAFELDGKGKARMRDVLSARYLSEQLFAVQHSLADLAAWYTTHQAAAHAEQSADDWLASLSAQAQQRLERWDQFICEMGLTR